MPTLPTDDSYIDQAALAANIDPRFMRKIMAIESGGQPNAVTGSYKGLFQLSEPEFKKHGGAGNIFDPIQQSQAAARKFRTEADTFLRKYGREPTPGELYLIHQQGEGGYNAHYSYPQQPAWQSMASTEEGRQKGPLWAKKAIWGNLPDSVKKKYGSVENVRSQDFMDYWISKVEGTPYNATVKLAQIPNMSSKSGNDLTSLQVQSQNQLGQSQAAQKLLEMFQKPMPQYDYMLPQIKLTKIDYNPFKNNIT